METQVTQEMLADLETAPVAQGVAAVQRLTSLPQVLQVAFLVVLLLTLVRLQQPNS